jgi:hypothetical protein
MLQDINTNNQHQTSKQNNTQQTKFNTHQKQHQPNTTQTTNTNPTQTNTHKTLPNYLLKFTTPKKNATPIQTTKQINQNN